MPSSSRDGLCVTSTEAKARFKAVRLVAHKARPQVAARDQLAQVGHHLTAVAHAERQRLRTMEEGRELIAHALVEQNRLRPALARAQHVAVGEAAAGYQAWKSPRPVRPASRSLICTSMASKPARWKAAAISTWEFTPARAGRPLSAARRWQCTGRRRRR